MRVAFKQQFLVNLKFIFKLKNSIKTQQSKIKHSFLLFSINFKLILTMNEQEQSIENQDNSKIKLVRVSTIKCQTYTPKTQLEKLSFMLIRPPKITYDPQIIELSSTCGHFTYQVQKIPFDLSIYLPKKQVQCVVLYLHGNTSNRLEGWMILKYLPPNYGLACFDFQGCGNRNGSWITLGLNQSKQVNIAIQYLKKKGYEVIGWGRSMGAVSLLISQGCDIMIVDSPFACLKSLCYQTVKSAESFPKCLNCIIECFFPMIYSCLRKQILDKTETDIYELEVWKYVQQIDQKKAILFMCGNKDEMIDKQHSVKLWKSFKGYKDLFIFSGTHNSNRGQQVYRKSTEFIDLCLIRKKKLDQMLNSLSNIKPVRQEDEI